MMKSGSIYYDCCQVLSTTFKLKYAPDKIPAYAKYIWNIGINVHYEQTKQTS